MKSSTLQEPKFRHLYLESCPTPVILSVYLSMSVYLLSTKPVPQSQKEIRLICHAEDLRFAELKGGILFLKIQSYSLTMPGKLSQH